MSDQTPEEMEGDAGTLLSKAYLARMERGDPQDAHEMRHIHAAVKAGNTDDCDPAACKLDAIDMLDEAAAAERERLRERHYRTEALWRDEPVTRWVKPANQTSGNPIAGRHQTSSADPEAPSDD